jgi:endonuclease/exonuclease/phosphatase family metal-dependent hydrolase
MWRFILKYASRFEIFLFLATLVVYGSSWISPAQYAIWGFISWGIPMVFMFHFLNLVYRLLQNRQKVGVSLLSLLLGWNFLTATLALNVSLSTQKPDFQVLSYNVHVFNAYKHFQKEKPHSSQKLIAWVANHSAEIKCLQEFHNLSHDSTFNTIQKIAKDKGYYFYTAPTGTLHSQTGFFGSAIFSKYPIIRAGSVIRHKYPDIRNIFADILIRQDTVRIICLHLQSMNIDDKNLEGNDQYSGLIKKISGGFRFKAREMEQVEKFLKASPHPVILCGDLNDLPYSYIYQRLKKYLYNAFESKGSAFGFTYNGNIPCLRIDNQFFGYPIQCVDFKTLYQMTYSDHFPILAGYRMK